jgi:hypothetical protein
MTFMEPKLRLDARRDAGNFSILTSTGTRYRAFRRSVGEVWFVQRFPSPGARSLWLDLGGPVERFCIEVGKAANFRTGGGYQGDSLWAVSSEVVSITEEAGALSSAEIEYLLQYSGVDMTPRTAAEDAAEYEAAVERFRRAVAEVRPVTIEELSELLQVDPLVFRGRSEDELSIIMSTPQDDLRIDGVAVTPWAWLAARQNFSEVFDVLFNDVEW